MAASKQDSPKPPPNSQERAHATQERTVRALVRGQVQGVGFRFHTLREAQRLGLSGQVRNLADGSVEVVAQGPRPQVQALLAWLGQGPAWADVTTVEVSELGASQRWHGFQVTG